MSKYAFLGVDPGGRYTGLVLRVRDDLLAWRVLERTDDLAVPDGRYVREVVNTAVELVGRCPPDPDLVIVAEGVAYWPPGDNDDRPPNLTGLLGAAVVLGGVLARWPPTVVVPPGSGHGSLHPSAYPAPIQPPGKGADVAQHARSAWDCTHHGETLYKRRIRQQEEHP